MPLQQKNKTMKKEKSRIYYDEAGDMLEVFIGKPTDCYYENIGDEVFMRIDEKTGKTKGFMIIAFKKRLIKFNNYELPVEEPLKI